MGLYDRGRNLFGAHLYAVHRKIVCVGNLSYTRLSRRLVRIPRQRGPRRSGDDFYPERRDKSLPYPEFF